MQSKSAFLELGGHMEIGGKKRSVPSDASVQVVYVHKGIEVLAS